jgi:hypothetical protein
VTRPSKVAGLGLAAAASVALAACGSSSQTVTRARVQAARGVVPSAQFFAGRRRDVARTTDGRPVKARSEPAAVNDEVSNTGARTVNPCNLVSRAQASSITGTSVGKPVEAPQGPTCIYKVHGFPGTITLALESTPFSTARPQSQLHGRMSVKVDGRAAYCGAIGTPTLIVPLRGDRFLSVAAPCPIAAAFAARALRHVG